MNAGDEEARLRGVRLSHPDKVLYPEQGLTKRDLAGYFDAASKRLLTHIRGRLLSLVRCPQGPGGGCFFQRHGAAGLPGEIGRIEIAEKNGEHAEYLHIGEAKGLVAAAQMGVLELHVWGSRIDRIEQPDRLVFDLDPGPGVEFAAVKQAADEVRQVLEALDLRCFPLLTGGKGVHVVAPVRRRHDWPAIKAFTRAVAERLAEQAPARYLANMSKAKREGRIFIDYLRNERGSTAIAPYSPRARPGAPVAWPVDWAGLGRATAANQVGIVEAAGRLAEADPWEGYESLRQVLKASAFTALGL